MGSVTPSTAFAAMAASIALPPDLQNLDGGERRQRLARGRHAVLANGRRASDKWSCLGTIDSHRMFYRIWSYDGDEKCQ